MDTVTEVLFLLFVTVSTWSAGSWALFKLNKPIACWAVLLTMLLVQGAALVRICTIPIE